MTRTVSDMLCLLLFSVVTSKTVVSTPENLINYKTTAKYATSGVQISNLLSNCNTLIR